jgi:hypothetical protein
VRVADRWHLLENASRTFLDVAYRCMGQIGQVLGSATIDPVLQAPAERIQHVGCRHRDAADIVIAERVATGMPIKEIVRCTGCSRGIIRKILRVQRTVYV